ncbi:CDP-6-deoxy-delta-3,4-glucoseen reductase [Castellaniella sp.]|uniref:CDP-6-deoxy-delta-3,4-glucoseen reductase n=1 Tax=Castellaniella sp. TaxID=1955812 RepID=UPI0035648D55
MGFKVTVQPSGKIFSVEPGQTVLDAALAEGILLPYSCRNGTCSTCQGRVVSGDYDAGSAPARILDAAELAAGHTLLCQARPLSDLVVDVQEVQLSDDIQVARMPVRVLALEPLAPDVLELTLQLPSAQAFRFQPGQYLDFLFPDGARRSYSMACPRLHEHTLTLHVRHSPGGFLTDRLFGQADPAIKVRDILRIEGPLGSFFVRPEIDRPLVFLASGTGFAPIRAMIEALAEGGDARSAVLYWGGRRPADLYQLDVARGWETRWPGFRVVPVVSDAAPDDVWSGRTGWVHSALMADLPDLSGHQVYACGSPLMVEAARRDLVQHCGLPADCFFADAFVTEADRARVTA